MEEKVLEAINHIKSKSKNKDSYKNILSYIQKATASNIDLEMREETLSDIVVKKNH